MSPTSTSDGASPPSDGAPSGPAVPPPLPSALTPASTPAPVPAAAAGSAAAGPPGTPPGTPPVSLRRGVFLDLFAAIGLLLLANVVLGSGVAIFHLARLALAGEAFPPGDELAVGMTPPLIVAAVFATLIAGVLTWWTRARRLPSLPAMRAATAYPLAIGAGLLIQAVCIGISMLAAQSGNAIAPTNADPLEQLGRQAPWLMWSLAVVVAPVGEELLFRHVLVRRFALAGRAALGIVLTSLLFAAMHEPVPGDQGVVAWLAAVALYVAMGSGFGLVYVRTGRLGAAIAAHAACNLAAVSLAAFSTL